MKTSRSKQGGFTLSEVMLAVAALTVLGSVTVPKISTAVRRTQEGNIRGELAKIRGAVSVYYTDQGHYPTDDLTSLVPSQLRELPPLHVPGHHEVQAGVITETTPTDTGKWSYDNVSGDAHWGEVRIGCLHVDLNGRAWAAH